MKKIVIMLVALSLLLCACGGNTPAETNASQETEGQAALPVAPVVPDTTETEPEETEYKDPNLVINNREYSFILDGVTLTPGEAFDASALPEANSLYQIPSCAFEGTDNVYSYNACEVTAYNEGSGEVIYSIYLLDPAVMTPEGLALGDDEAKIVAAYGPSYNLSDGQYTYIGRNSQLIILTSSGFVTSIEYRITE